jgi:hypothetical protein
MQAVPVAAVAGMLCLSVAGRSSSQIVDARHAQLHMHATPHWLTPVTRFKLARKAAQTVGYDQRDFAPRSLQPSLTLSSTTCRWCAVGWH